MPPPLLAPLWSAAQRLQQVPPPHCRQVLLPPLLPMPPLAALPPHRLQPRAAPLQTAAATAAAPACFRQSAAGPGCRRGCPARRCEAGLSQLWPTRRAAPAAMRAGASAARAPLPQAAAAAASARPAAAADQVLLMQHPAAPDAAPAVPAARAGHPRSLPAAGTVDGSTPAAAAARHRHPQSPPAPPTLRQRRIGRPQSRRCCSPPPPPRHYRRRAMHQPCRPLAPCQSTAQLARRWGWPYEGRRPSRRRGCWAPCCWSGNPGTTRTCRPGRGRSGKAAAGRSAPP